MTSNNQGDLTLVERLEAAEAGSVDLNKAVWMAFGGWKGVDNPPAFSTSIDAIMVSAAHYKLPKAMLFECDDGIWGAHFRDENTSFARTAPLALCAAVLTALNPEQSHGV